jgi:WD40 repeat protein
MIRLEGHTADVMSLAFAPNGETIASASWDGTVRLWPRLGGRPEVLRTGNDHALAVAYSLDGSHLAAGFRSKQPAALGHGFGHLAYIPLIERPGRIGIGIRHMDTWFSGNVESGTECIAFCRDKPWLLAAAGPSVEAPESLANSGVAMYHVLDRVNIGAFRPAGASIRSIAFSPDGTRLAGVSRKPGQGLFVWDIRKVHRSGLTVFPASHRLPVADSTGVSIAYSCDNQTIVGAFTNGRIALWTPGCEPRFLESGHIRKSLRGIALSPDGRLLATAGADGQIKLWDSLTFQQVQVFDWKAGDAHCVAFAPDGLSIAAGGNGPIIVWDL